MSEPVDVFVCVTCQQGEARPGAELLAAMRQSPQAAIRLHAVECMSVCTRPCTVAVSSPKKWTYIVGDMGVHSAGELMEYIQTYAASEHGTPPLKQRPPAIRKGTIARIPPLTEGTIA